MSGLRWHATFKLFWQDLFTDEIREIMRQRPGTRSNDQIMEVRALTSSRSRAGWGAWIVQRLNQSDNVSFKRQRKPKGLKLVSWLKILFLKNILLSNIHELVFVFNVWYKLFLLILTLTFGILIKVVRVMKGMSKQFCEYSLGIQKKICQYSFYDK